MTANGTTVLTMDGFQTAKPVAMSMDDDRRGLPGQDGEDGRDQGHRLRVDPRRHAGRQVLKISTGQNDQLGELLEGGDPTKIFKSFDSSLASVKFVRTETIGGQKLDRYAVTVNTAKALAAQGKKVPAGVPKTLTYSMWMDKSHLVRRLSFDLAGVSMVMTMSDYNKPVSITAPPASKIVSR